MQLHPDKTGGDTALEERFKSVNTANEVGVCTWLSVVGVSKIRCFLPQILSDDGLRSNHDDEVAAFQENYPGFWKPHCGNAKYYR